MDQLLHKHFIWQDYYIKYSILKIKVLKLDNVQVKWMPHHPSMHNCVNVYNSGITISMCFLL